MLGEGIFDSREKMLFRYSFSQILVFRTSIELELYHATDKLVRELLEVKAGENVLIYCDTGCDMKLADATAASAYSIGAHPIVMYYEKLPEVQMEPPKIVAAAMKSADLIIEYAKMYLIYTKAFREALEAGARAVCLTDMTAETCINVIGKIDYPKLMKLTEAIRDMVAQAEHMKITTPSGSDIVFENPADCQVRFATGYAKTQGEMGLIGGAIAWLPIMDTLNGKVVWDACMFPPQELGLIKTPIQMEIKKGKIVDISGGIEAQAVKKWFESFEDPNMYKVAHVTLGFNPGVRVPSGQIAVDERLYGCLEFGFGHSGFPGGKPAKSHTDAVAANASIWIDDEPMAEEGRYIHPKLAALCKELGVK